jgi:hypothetical protein
LLFNAETRHGRSVDHACGKGVRCVAKSWAAIEPGLEAASVCAKFNGVEVNTSSILGCHLRASGKPIDGHPESCVEEELGEGFELNSVYGQI